MSLLLDTIVTCVYLCRAAAIPNIYFRGHSCSVTLTFHLLMPNIFTTKCNYLAIANDAKQRWRCEHELKRDGWRRVLTVSALWQSTGVAKAQKQIQTIPTSPTRFPSRGSGVSSMKKTLQLFPSMPGPGVTCRWESCTGSVLYSAH